MLFAAGTGIVLCFTCGSNIKVARATRGEEMPHSVDRFLTTHTGSLPRPDDLIPMMYAKEEGRPVDREAVAKRIRSAVGEVVRSSERRASTSSTTERCRSRATPLM